MKHNIWMGISAVIAMAIVIAAPPTQAAPVKVTAAGVDNLIEGAKQCTRHLSRNERKYGIPMHLLTAIASTESGRWHSGLNLALPWPWTVNSEGKGYYFDSKQEAVDFVKRQRAKGVKSMDIGCMQVNLHHHPTAFASIEQGFDPATNINYAAQFLRNNYQDGGSWRKAAAYYHSRTPTLGNQYVASVYKSWQRIVTRVREAKAGQMTTGQSFTASNLGKGAQAQPPSLDTALANAPKDFPNAVTPKPPAPKYKPIQMRVIEVKKRDSSDVQVERGVRIIRPEASRTEPTRIEPTRAEVTTTTTKNSPSDEPDDFVSGRQDVPSQPRVIKVNGGASKTPASNGTTGKRSGPNFIFD